MYNFYLNREEEKNLKKYQDYERLYRLNDTINRVFELTPLDGRKHWWNTLSYGFEYTVSELINIV